MGLFKDLVSKVFGDSEKESLKRYEAAKNRKKSSHGRSQLMQALASGNEKKAMELLKNNHIKLEEKDFSGGATPLIVAVKNNMPEIARALVEKGADISAKTTNNENALIFAIRSGNEELAIYLIDHKVPLKIDTFNYRKSPLVMAAGFGRSKIIQVLLDESESWGAEIMLEALVFAIGNSGSQEIVSLLVDAGANVNGFQQNLNFNPLMYAAKGGNLQIVEYLLQKGANPELQCTNYGSPYFGIKPLMFAAEKGHLDIVKTLVEAGSAINDAIGALNDTTMRTFNFEEEVRTPPPDRISYSPNADITDREEYNKTALWYAVEKNHLETARYLIEQGADTNIHDDDGNILLKPAVVNGSLEMVKLLTPLCPDFHTPNIYGHSPYSYSLNYQPEILKFFQSLEN